MAVTVFCACSWVAPPLGCATSVPFTTGFFGNVQQYRIRPNDTLIELARKFDLGFNEIADANPGIDPFIPKPGTVITIPSAWILPSPPRRPVILINLPEFRLYYFPKSKSQRIFTFPLGIGDEGKDTPVGSYRVVEKIRRPAWHVPVSIRSQVRGLPKVVPPGPDNPLGSHALRLSLRSVLIHGTNRPWGIGRRSSHGCLRLYPEDIVRLFNLVPIGMRVIVVNDPVKVAGWGDRVFVEAHRYEHRQIRMGKLIRLLADRKLIRRTDFSKLLRAVEEKKGYPIDVTLRLPPRTQQQREREVPLRGGALALPRSPGPP